MGRNTFQTNGTLKSESNIVIGWFAKNEVTINPDKFQAIVLDKKKSNLTNILLTIYNQATKPVSSVELLGIAFGWQAKL